jgi:hypothetical protein
MRILYFLCVPCARSATVPYNGSRASTRDTQKNTQWAEDGTLDIYKILKF